MGEEPPADVVDTTLPEFAPAGGSHPAAAVQNFLVRSCICIACCFCVAILSPYSSTHILLCFCVAWCSPRLGGLSENPPSEGVDTTLPEPSTGRAVVLLQQSRISWDAHVPALLVVSALQKPPYTSVLILLCFRVACCSLKLEGASEDDGFRRIKSCL